MTRGDVMVVLAMQAALVLASTVIGWRHSGLGGAVISGTLVLVAGVAGWVREDPREGIER